ncbi:MAG: CcoQ/FixQ family Cbb3-type cytochrome c oxidase assembly chaperone [Bacteroidota bacterium]
MYKNILQSITGIEIYPILSLAIFFGIFACVMIWFFKVSKEHLEKMSNIPLDNNIHQTS